MRRYNVKIRLAGSVQNEILKNNIPAAEVMLLRRLHGFDAVHIIDELPNDKSEHDVVRADLEKTYGKALEKLEPSPMTFEQIFGPSHMPLPGRLPDIEKREKQEKAESAAAAAGDKPPGRTQRTPLPNDVDVGSVDLEQLAS